MNDILIYTEKAFSQYFYNIEVARVLVIIIYCFVIGLFVLLSHISIVKLFDLDLLKIGNTIKWSWLFWLLGSTATYLLLYCLNLVSLNIQAIVVVAFTWNMLLKNTFDSLSNNKDKQNAIDKSDETLSLDMDDFGSL